MKKQLFMPWVFIIFLVPGFSMAVQDVERGGNPDEGTELVSINSGSRALNYETGGGRGEQEAVSHVSPKREWGPFLKKCGKDGLVCSVFCVFYIILPIGGYYLCSAHDRGTWTPWMPVNYTLGDSY